MGATISSNKKIAVNQGHMGLSVANGGQDMSMTQNTRLRPILVKNMPLSVEMERIKLSFQLIIATENDTKVYVNNDKTVLPSLP